MWDRIYSTDGSGLTPTNWAYSFNELLQMSMRCIEDVERPFVVDDGCGKGELAIGIADARKYAKVVGIDHSSVGIGIARKNALEKGLDNVEFRKSLIQKYLENGELSNRDLSIAVNTYQYFINDPGKPNDMALNMMKKLSYNMREGGYFLMTAPDLEFFGEELFPEFVDYTDPLPCYRVTLPNGDIPHQETLFGEQFVELFNDSRNSIAFDMLDHGKLPFDARSIFPIIGYAKSFGVSLDELNEKTRCYIEMQKKDPMSGPTVDWYLFRKS